MRGFTLIELLIVITIIAILSIIGIVAYSGFLQTARNNKRQSDLKIIQSALEDFHADQLYYPGKSTLCVNGQLTTLVPTCGLKNSVNTKIYLNNIPTDPKSNTTTPYYYQPLPSSPSQCNNTTIPCTSYCLSANLEGTIDLLDECTPASGYNYGVTKP